MSNYRRATLLASKSIATAGTEPTEVKVKDPITDITAVVKATSAGTVMSCHPAEIVSKIEIVDGSDVIASLKGYQVQALDYYRTGKMPYNFLSDSSGTMSIVTYRLAFGRNKWDRELALDPSRFDSLMLNVTHNYRESDASASAASLEIYANVFDQRAISPVGYIRPKQHYTYTCGAEGSEQPIALPSDNFIRKALIFGRASDYFPWQVANKVRLEESGGARKPFDFTTSAYLKEVNAEYGQAYEAANIAINSTARDVYCAPRMDVRKHFIAQTVTNIISTEGADKAVPFQMDITASELCEGYFMGKNPHGAFPIDFGDQNDLTDWFNAPALAKSDLIITAGSAGTNGKVDLVLEELKRYG
jgi:hypothetical protein